MPSTKILLFLVCALLLASCTRDQVYRGIYEGTTTRERLQNPPDPDHAPLSYDQYQRQRKTKDQ